MYFLMFVHKPYLNLEQSSNFELQLNFENVKGGISLHGAKKYKINLV